MTPRQMMLGVNLVAGLMIVSIALALAGLTWRLMGEPGGDERPLAPVTTIGPPAPLDLTPVLQLAPFGAAEAPAGGAGGSTAGLLLRGIVRAVPSFRSTALIASAGGTAEPYAVGETLPGGAVLDAIEIDYVMLRVAGRREPLAFPQKPSAVDTSGIAAIRAAIPASVLGIAPPPVGTAPTGSAAATSAAIEDYRDRIATGPQTLVGALGAAATPQGYRIGPTPPPQMRNAGLIPGDLVEKVNGVQVGDAERDRKVFDEAVVSGRARVEVLRDGRRIILSFPLR